MIEELWQSEKKLLIITGVGVLILFIVIIAAASGKRLLHLIFKSPTDFFRMSRALSMCMYADPATTKIIIFWLSLLVFSQMGLLQRSKGKLPSHGQKKVLTAFPLTQRRKA